jgi:hypothetical protein
MALVFGGATSDRVAFGSATDIDNQTTMTVALWVYPTTVTGTRVFISKVGSGGNTGGWRFIFDNASGNMNLRRDRATTQLNYTTNNNGLTANSWRCVAATFDTGANDGHIYSGDLSSTMVEHTYGTSTGGSGAITGGASDSANTMFVGNNSGTASAFQGRIAMVGVWARVLTLAELREWQFDPTPLGSSCRLFTNLYDGMAGAPMCRLVIRIPAISIPARSSHPVRLRILARSASPHE